MLSLSAAGSHCTERLSADSLTGVKRLLPLSLALAVFLAGGAAVVLASDHEGEPSPGAGAPEWIDTEDDYPPGIEKKGENLPPGLAKKKGITEWEPPGQAKKGSDWSPPGKSKGEGWLPPGHARKGTFPHGLFKLGKTPKGWLAPSD